MNVRRLWSRRLGAWLFGAGVAWTCAAPGSALSGALGGAMQCTGANQVTCYYNGTSNPCGSAFACVAWLDIENPKGVVNPSIVACPSQCYSPAGPASFCNTQQGMTGQPNHCYY